MNYGALPLSDDGDERGELLGGGGGDQKKSAPRRTSWATYVVVAFSAFLFACAAQISIGRYSYFKYRALSSKLGESVVDTIGDDIHNAEVSTEEFVHECVECLKCPFYRQHHGLSDTNNDNAAAALGWYSWCPWCG